jgi:hypothetical protein
MISWLLVHHLVLIVNLTTNLLAILDMLDILLLMTKFVKAGKTGLSDFPNRHIRFWQFQSRIKKEAKHEDLKIRESLKHEKGEKRHQGANPCVDDQI